MEVMYSASSAAGTAPVLPSVIILDSNEFIACTVEGERYNCNVFSTLLKNTRNIGVFDGVKSKELKVIKSPEMKTIKIFPRYRDVIKCDVVNDDDEKILECTPVSITID